MAKVLERLEPLFVERVTEPGMYPDGGNLYLQVTASGAKSWIFRFTLHGRSREMGLGGVADISLKKARQLARDARELKSQGIDPIERKHAQRAEKIAQAARLVTFEQEATSYIKAHTPGWKNGGKQADQWRRSLETYAFPIIGDVAVQDVDTAMITRILEPIWSTKTETANRVRNRIELILDRAAVRGHRSKTEPNPARWRGCFEHIFPDRRSVQPTRHHPALPYAEISEFMAKLRTQPGTAALALELTILCAVRTADTIGATWAEIDLASKVWTLPKARTKTRDLRVPLSPAALAVLKRLKQGKPSDFLFEGDREGEPLSNNAMLDRLDRMGCGHVTTHGFRSTFKDWAMERTSFPTEISEMALAHSIGSKTEEAYRRGDLFEKRRRLMEAWAAFCAQPSVKGEVVTMKRKSK